MSRRRAERILVLATAALSLGGLCAQAQGRDRPARVLLVFQQQAETSPMLDFSRSLRTAIRDELRSPVEFFQESLDLDRFAGSEHSLGLDEYFRKKYRGFDVDVIVAVGTRALEFAVDHLKDTFPRVPVVFALCAAPRTDSSSLGGNVTGRLAAASRFIPTLAFARGLQPDAEHIVIIGGAGTSDSASMSAVLTAIAASRVTLPIAVLQGLSLNVLLRQIHQLPRRSIVIFANFRQDGAGQIFEPVDIVGSIAHASAAPMYAQLLAYVGEGVVGGSVVSFADEGVRTGRLVARVLRRRPGEPLPPVQNITESFAADWRELHRWQLSEARLPPGTVLFFRETSAWERYRTVALVSLSVIVAESLLIGTLLVERRRRKRAQLVAHEQQRSAEDARRQIAHMGRVALVGELAATISHELRQPLAAIRANAEAGTLLLGSKSRDPSEAGKIFHDIVVDDVRAIDVIESVRRLLRKEEVGVTTVDLNDVCRDAVRLLQHDASMRGVRLVVALAPTRVMVIGDPVQLQQIVLNLVLNGLEAASASDSTRYVVVHTERRLDEAELWVHDSGAGMTDDVLPRVFDSFFSTKASGLGMGLVIVRSIVERHHGRVHAENHPLGGAIFRVQLPVAAEAPVSKAWDDDAAGFSVVRPAPTPLRASPHAPIPEQSSSG